MQKKLRRQANVPPLHAISMAMRRRWNNTCGIARCSMSRATPEATGRCHQATTRSVLPRRPPGRQQTKQWCKCVHFVQNVPTLLAVLMAVVVCRYYTSTRIAQWRRRIMAFLNATKRRHWVSTRSDSVNQTCLPLILGVYFIVKLLKKGSSCPNNKRGMTHQVIWWEALK